MKSKDSKLYFKPWFFYKYGLMITGAGFGLLLIYLVIFLLNPVIFPLFGPNGPNILRNIQNIILSISVIVFITGFLGLVIGVIRREQVLYSWLAVVFLAPAFFVMTAIVFVPILQGLSFSFTNADQQNMSKMLGKKIIAPTFQYVGFDNFVHVFTGKSKRKRMEERELKKNIQAMIKKMTVEKRSDGTTKIIITDLHKMDPEQFRRELNDKFVKTDEEGNKEFSRITFYKDLSQSGGEGFELIVAAGEDWKKVVLAVFMPKNEIPRFYFVFWRSIIWTVFNVVFHFMLGMMLALLLNKKIMFKAGYRLLLLLPWGVPQVVTAFSWRWLFNYDFGFINIAIRAFGGEGVNWLSDPKLMLIAAIITNIWLGFPFMTVTLLGGLQTIPGSFYESAQVDGAGPFKQFISITLPLLKPVSMTVILLGSIWTFNMFNIIWLVTQQNPEADILVTYAFREFYLNWNIGRSGAYTSVIMILLIFFAYSYWRLLKGGEEIYK